MKHTINDLYPLGRTEPATFQANAQPSTTRTEQHTYFAGLIRSAAPGPTALAACLAALALGLAGCGPRHKVAADQPVPVRVRAPQRIVEPVSVAAGGSVEANITAQSAFQIPGRVARVLVEEGQPVKQGQVLAELDSTDYRNAYDGAKAQADAARAVERKSADGLRPEELEQARIDFERWQDEYKRMKFLYDHQSLAANDFKKIEAGYQAAAQRYQMAKIGTRPEEKDSASAQARGAAAQMHEAEKHLADCQLRAPIAGFVAMRRIDVGDTVGAGVPVLVVMDLDPVKVRVGIPEAEIGKVRQGARAVVTVPSLGRDFEGKVEVVGVAAEAASRSYTVKIAVPNLEHVLKAGMVSEARVFGQQMVTVLTVPGNAVVRDLEGVTHVYVYDPARQRVYARRVEVGAPVRDEVEIKSGLTADDQVVVAGQQNVREGQPAKLAGGAQ